MSAQQGGVSRRSFLVSMAGTVLGAYMMPAKGFEALTEEEAKETVRELFSPPHKQFTDNGYFLLWTENLEEGTKLMIWTPETEEEFADAQRFYEGSRGQHLTIDETNLPPVPKRGPEEQRLIDNILDNRDDLQPRRAYAEWLKQRGSTQGDYVLRRFELERMETDDSVDVDTFYDYCDERDDLCHEHAEEWFAPLTALHTRPIMFGVFLPQFWCEPVGFIEKVDLTRPDILPDRADYFFSAVPLVSELHLNYDDARFERIGSLPQMKQIVTLKVLIGTDSGLRILCTSPHLRGLRNIELRQSPLLESGGRMLCSSRILPRLETLDLSQCGLGNKGVLALFGSARPLKLTSIDLGYNKIGDEGIGKLADTPGLRHLSELILISNYVSAEALQSWQQARFLSTLNALDLESCELNARAGEALASLPFEALADLTLSSNEFGDTGVRALASSPALAKLERLDVGRTEMTGDGLIALAESSHFSPLVLKLSHNTIDSRGFEALAASSAFATLQELEASWTECGDEGLIALAQSGQPSNLTKLDMSTNQITSAAVRALVESSAFPNLEELNLGGNEIGFEGARLLANVRTMPNLESVTVLESSVGERGAKLLFARFGEDNVTLDN